jgi:hypothetical protein
MTTRGTRFERPSPKKRKITKRFVEGYRNLVDETRLEMLKDQLATGMLEPLPRDLIDESLPGVLENHLKTRMLEPLQSIWRGHLKDLRKECVSLLPGNTPGWIRSIPICACHTGDPNPCVVCGPNDHPIVVLDHAFLVGVRRSAGCYCLSFNILAQHVDIRGNFMYKDIIQDRDFQRIFQLMDLSRKEFLNGEVKDPPLYARVEGRDRIEAAMLTDAILFFVIAHEISHVLLGHLDRGSLSLMPNLAGDISIYQKSQLQEFEADRKAASFYKSMSHKYPPQLLGAPLMLMRFLDFLEPSPLDRASHNCDTHPLSRDRYDSLLPVLPPITGRARNYLNYFGGLMGICKLIVAIQERKEGWVPANTVIDEIVRLVRKTY